MKYATPELVVLGPAPVLVQGIAPGLGDNGSSETSQTPLGLAIGLDD
jgi:hypothetical protein